MKAIEFKAGSDLDDEGAARLVDLPRPEARGHDLLVRVEAVSVNPVDTKLRPGRDAADAVLGYDAAGSVEAAGEDARGFTVGDRVYYAGDIRRPGSNAELQLVDARIAALRPETLDAPAAAALPLTTLTAWEALYERLGIDPGGGDTGRSLLIIGGAGGVGSMAIQLAKRAGLRVLATASRPESTRWCEALGASDVLDHAAPLRPQLEERGLSHVDFIGNFHDSSAYWEVMGDLIAPLGKIVLIVEPRGPVDLGGPLKQKSVTLAWEFMFTRSMFTTPDMDRQRHILEQVARWIDAGQLRSTLGRVLGVLNPDNLVAAHRQIESGRTVGKLVLAGWEQ